MNKFLSPSPIYQDLGLTIVRVITGLFMVYHGWEVFDAETMRGYLEWEVFKHPSGKTWVYFGKITELISGLLLAIGLFTRLGAFILLGTSAYIAFCVGHGIIWYNDQHPFMFVLLAIVYLTMGGGNWSLDKKLFA